jgi:hypothetical protein|tara:strand:+ start:2930 stop:3304 length:375 start_codon:yes stop_codon:yes gene_type:complete
MNQYKGEVTGKLGDKERTFRLTFESIVNIENITGKSIIQLTTDMSGGKYSFKDLLTILHQGLLGTKTNILKEAVGDAMMQSGLIKSSELAGIVLASAFTGETKEDDNPLVPAENTQNDTQSKNT